MKTYLKWLFEANAQSRLMIALEELIDPQPCFIRCKNPQKEIIKALMSLKICK